MAAGHPLDDADRAPWLAAIAAWIRAHVEAGRGCVVTCSGLAVRYRDVLRTGDPDLLLVHLVAAPELVRARVAARTDHYMTAVLVNSQFAALEPLTSAEHGLTIDANQPVDDIVETVIQGMRR